MQSHYVTYTKIDKGIRLKHSEEVNAYPDEVPPLTALLIAPKGNHCNTAQYEHCPHLLFGGYCEAYEQRLGNEDGYIFITTYSGVRTYNNNTQTINQLTAPTAHGIAVGSVRQYKKCTECRNGEKTNETPQ
jgi:hypothetical protein